MFFNSNASLKKTIIKISTPCGKFLKLLERSGGVEGSNTRKVKPNKNVVHIAGSVFSGARIHFFYQRDGYLPICLIKR